MDGIERCRCRLSTENGRDGRVDRWVGVAAAIPAVAGCVGGLVGGLWSDWMLKRGFSLTAARKTPIISGLVLSSTIVAANYVHSSVIVILVMSLAFFARGVGKLKRIEEGESDEIASGDVPAAALKPRHGS